MTPAKSVSPTTIVTPAQAGAQVTCPRRVDRRPLAAGQCNAWLPGRRAEDSDSLLRGGLGSRLRGNDVGARITAPQTCGMLRQRRFRAARRYRLPRSPPRAAL